VNISNSLKNRTKIAIASTRFSPSHRVNSGPKKWYSILIIAGIVSGVWAGSLSADERIILAPDTPDSKIVRMHPKNVDPSQLPLDSIKELHTTGHPIVVDIKKWRLEVKGPMVNNPVLLGYEDLTNMVMIKKNVLLICPGFFADYAEWEGVPLSDLLKEVEAERNYKKITFHSMDGYSTSFDREEIKRNLFFLALKVNGETLPREHGFPVRLVAEDFYGGRWVKWIKAIEVQ